MSARRRRTFLRLATTAVLGGRCAVAAAQTPSVSLAEAARRLGHHGHVLMMRHALTEAGIGDPPHFRVDDCSTQRNLSAAGREQARATGAALRAQGVRIDEVRSSAWCRCRDTAQLAFGAHSVWPALNSFFQDDAGAPAQTRAVLDLARQAGNSANLMLVTHQVNITAACGEFASAGEIVACRWRDGQLAAEFRFRASV